MSPLSIRGRIKLEHTVSVSFSPRIKREDSISLWNQMHPMTNIVKEECAAKPVKVEPKTEIITPPEWYTSMEMNLKHERPKREKSLSVSAVQRRPQLPLAVKVHKYLMSKDPRTLSQKELGSLTWAESVIVYNILRQGNKSPAKDVPVKVPNPFAWRNREKSTCGIPNTLELQIVDFGSPDGKYTTQRGQLIQATFNKAVIDHILRQVIPKFGATTWRNGVLVLDCKDSGSYQFAQDTVSKMMPWRRAILRAVPIKEENLTYRGRLNAPDIGIKVQDVIPILASQNPKINMHNWRVIEEWSISPGFKTYILSIVQPPEKFLQDRCLKLFFGVTELPLELVTKENLS